MNELAQELYELHCKSLKKRTSRDSVTWYQLDQHIQDVWRDIANEKSDLEPILTEDKFFFFLLFISSISLLVSAVVSVIGIMIK